jgi:DNA-binding transcriptional regulator YdaS (Cro superfamily)
MGTGDPTGVKGQEPPPLPPTALARLLTGARRYAAVSQFRVANEIGIRESEVADAERARRGVSASRALAYVEILRIPPSIMRSAIDREWEPVAAYLREIGQGHLAADLDAADDVDAAATEIEGGVPPAEDDPPPRRSGGRATGKRKR